MNGPGPRHGEYRLARLTSGDHFRECVDIQRVTWGDAMEIAPASVLQVSAKTGGFLAGAFDPSGTLAGFVWSLVGRFHGETVHWSHMLAVLPPARGMGLGLRLKQFQREGVLSDGIGAIYWTFDPLVARNAHLNLNRLGAQVQEYAVNMYGPSQSPLHGLSDTDRLVVRWELAGPRATAAAATGDPRGMERIEIPVNVEALLARGEDIDPWRQDVRDRFTSLLRRHYAVERFEAPHYILRPPG